MLLYKAASVCEPEQLAELKALIAKDRYDINYRADYDMTPLYVASLNNHVACAQVLIQAGAKLNYYDKDGWTPLMAAASFGEARMMKLLIDAGANPTRRATAGPHKGKNAKDLVKELVGKEKLKPCLELIEGAPLGPPRVRSRRHPAATARQVRSKSGG